MSEKRATIKFTVGERQPVIPSGEYQVRVEEIKETAFMNKRKTYTFVFRIVHGDFHDVLVRGFVNAAYQSFSEHTKMYKWASVVHKDDMEPGAELDLSAFYDKVFLVRIEPKKSKKTKNEFGNVTEIIKVIAENV